MKTSDQLDQFAPAYVAAQSEMDNATKNAKNPHFRNDYADLAEVLNTVRPVLNKHGLAIIQGPGTFEGGCISVDTRILHTSGQWIESTISLPLTKADAQGGGSATTYGRRYGGSAMCGIAQEDDDGEGAVKRDKDKKDGKGERGSAATVMNPQEAALALELAQVMMAIDGKENGVPNLVRALGKKDRGLGVKAYEAAKAAGLMK